MSVVIECYGCQKDEAFESPDDLPAIIDPWYCEGCKEEER